MKLHMWRYIHFFFVLAISSVTTSFSYHNQTTDCYRDECCGDTPLFCGVYDIQLQAGFEPIRWQNRGELDTVNCTGFINPVVKVFNFPNFKTFFRLPWIVGGQIGYALSDNTRIYGEFNYTQAGSKNKISIVSTNPLLMPAQTLALTINNYRIYDFYIGARYYCNRWRDCISVFFGAKVGLMHHSSANFKTFTVATSGVAPINLISSTSITPLFLHNTSISGGGNVGLDYDLWNNLALVLTAEVVANCGPKNNNNIVLSPSSSGVSAANIVMNGIQTELRFPIAAALRYVF